MYSFFHSVPKLIAHSLPNIKKNQKQQVVNVSKEIPAFTDFAFSFVEIISRETQRLSVKALEKILSNTVNTVAEHDKPGGWGTILVCRYR